MGPSRDPQQTMAMESHSPSAKGRGARGHAKAGHAEGRRGAWVGMTPWRSGSESWPRSKRLAVCRPPPCCALLRLQLEIVDADDEVPEIADGVGAIDALSAEETPCVDVGVRVRQ